MNLSALGRDKRRAQFLVKCIVSELNYSAYRVTSHCSALHWSEILAGNASQVSDLYRTGNMHCTKKYNKSY